MSIKRIVISTVGVIMSLLGLLWFLQGSGIVHLKPIMCVSACEEITGTSILWAVVGGVFFIVGLVLIFKDFKKRSKSIK